MVTGYEVGMYRDIGGIREALERIATALEKPPAEEVLEYRDRLERELRIAETDRDTLADTISQLLNSEILPEDAVGVLNGMGYDKEDRP